MKTGKPIHIFRAGDFGPKGRYTPAELAAMADRYNEDQKSTDPQRRKKAPIKFDHVDSGPAAGYVESLFVDGLNLFAVPDWVPAQIDKIKNEGWRNRSVEFTKGGSGYEFRALALLGGARPEVGGLEPIEFHESTDTTDGGTVYHLTFAFGEDVDTAALPVTIDSDATPGVVTFANVSPEVSPFPEAHGPIVEEVSTAPILGHSHVAFVDNAGRGFTSVPLVYIDGKLTPEEGGHVHQITAREIQTAGEIPHVHLFRVSGDHRRFSEATKPTAKESKPMPNTTTVDQNAGAAPQSPTTIQFTEMQAQLMRTQAELEQARKEKERADFLLRARKDADKIRTFSEGWNRAREKGTVPEALKGKASLIFDQLSDDAIQFTEGGETKVSNGQALFLAFLESLPASLDGLRNVTADTVETFAERKAAKAKMSEKRMSRPAFFAELEKRGMAKMKETGSTNAARVMAETEAAMRADGYSIDDEDPAVTAPVEVD
jgi:hypothetical protein